MLHVLSWNVAGWNTTLALIRQQHGSLETWLKKHQVDILCLQEVKATVEKLTMTPQAFGIQRGGTAAAVSGRSDSDAAPSLAEYESYWACCTSREAKGFNGVATFARKGLTLGANSTPLGSALFDDEGRVLATDHGYFVLFNVYAPNTGSSHRDRYHFKAEFYEKLQTAMHHVRRQGRSVICLGDLNVSARAEDLAPSFRVVHIERALNWKAPPERIRRDFDDSRAQLMMLTDIMKEFCFAWPHVVAMLRSKRITPVQIKCAKSMVTKFRVIADVPISQETGSLLGRQSAASKTRRVVLGTPFDKEEYAQWSYCLADERLAIPTSSHFAHLPSPETNVDSPNVFATRISEGAAPGSMNSIDPALTGRGVTLSLGELTECVTKSTNVSWTPSQVLLFSRINSFDAETLENKTSQLPVLSSRSPDIFAKWLTDLSIVDGMVDTYLAFHGNCQNRFTCWDQSKNKRYTNAGSRIDYVLLDAALFSHARRGRCLYGGKCSFSTAPTSAAHPTEIPSLSCSLPTAAGWDAPGLDAPLSISSSATVFPSKFQSLPERLDCGPACSCPRCHCSCAWSADAALAACTAFGRWQAAPFEGGGLAHVEGTIADHLTQFQPPHTGIVYTPPSLSDHVAVSLLLDQRSLDSALEQKITESIFSKLMTQNAQPHMRQSSIRSFFTLKTKTNSCCENLDSSNSVDTSTMHADQARLLLDEPQTNVERDNAVINESLVLPVTYKEEQISTPRENLRKAQHISDIDGHSNMNYFTKGTFQTLVSDYPVSSQVQANDPMNTGSDGKKRSLQCGEHESSNESSQLNSCIPTVKKNKFFDSFFMNTASVNLPRNVQGKVSTKAKSTTKKKRFKF